MKTLIATGILVFCHMYGSGQQMTLDECLSYGGKPITEEYTKALKEQCAP